MADKRMSFHERLEALDVEVTHLFAMVSEDLALATEAFIGGRPDVLAVLSERDHMIDSLQSEIEDVVCVQINLESPFAVDLRFLLSVLRIVPELERSHDLVLHIAQQAGRVPPDSLTAASKDVVAEMGRVGAAMWRLAADAWYQRDSTVAATLELRDDEMDDLHGALTRELLSGRVELPVAMNMTLVGRFYERLGDHAVNIARRVVYLAGPRRSR